MSISTLTRTLALLAVALPAFAAPVSTMYKDPYCGCCGKWAEHMAQNGIPLTTDATKPMAAIKDQLKVPANLRSCHTATIAGYVFEGHVPADLVKKVLKEKPAIAGLAVPGMPQGSPGMETGVKQPYQVIAFGKDGKQQQYATR